MLSRIEGILEDVDEDGRAEVRVGDMWYCVLVPGSDQQRLVGLSGERVVFHTLQYLEGSSQGGNLIPRLIGFATDRDRAFFELFTTVKNIGNRKALRALQLPFGRIAEAIASKDVKLLQSLPEIGKRSAETIIAELSGKVDRFIDVAVRDDAEITRADGEVEPKAAARRAMVTEAAAVLTALGEPRLETLQLIDRALAVDPQIESPQDLIEAVYKLKGAAV